MNMSSITMSFPESWHSSVFCAPVMRGSLIKTSYTKKKKPSHIKTSVDTGLCWRWNWGQKLFVGLLFTEFFLGLLGNVRIKSSSSYFYSISADCSKQRNRRKLTAERERNKRKGPGGLTWDWIDFCIVNERMWCFKSCHHYKQKQWDCSFLGLFCVIYYNLINKSRLYLFSFFP